MLLAFVFISYFVEPRDLLRRLLSLDIHTAAGISGAAVTLAHVPRFRLVRQRFCTTVCPYGYLQGMLGDGNTLLVHYRDERTQCIECKKCVRVCPMGIDIRNSPFQIECIHCGECIDACDEILARLKKPGLIHYAWGEKGEPLRRPAPWYRRGLRDAKRVVVLLVLLCYAAAVRRARRCAAPCWCRSRRSAPRSTAWRRRPRLQPLPLSHRQPRQQAGGGGLLDPATAGRDTRADAQSRARATRRIARRANSRSPRPPASRDDLVSHFTIADQHRARPGDRVDSHDLSGAPEGK